MWLYSIGVTDEQIRENFLYTALVDYFPGDKNGGHRVPGKIEISKEHDRLISTLRLFDPKLVVPIGKLSIANCLGQSFETLSENIGKVFEVDPYQALGFKVKVIPLPHPSGASTWRHKTQNKKLLIKALNLLSSSLEEI